MDLLRRDSPAGYWYARIVLIVFGPLGVVALIGSVVVPPLLWIVAMSAGMLIVIYLNACFFLITDIDRKREWRAWRQSERDSHVEDPGHTSPP